MARHGFCFECGDHKQVRPVKGSEGNKEVCFSCRVLKLLPAQDLPLETVDFLMAVKERSRVQQQLREALDQPKYRTNKR